MFDSFDVSYLAWMLIGFGLFMVGAAFFDWLRNRPRGGLLDDRTAAYITARPNPVDRVRFERLARRAGWQVSGQWSDEYQAYDDLGLQRLWLGFGWGLSLAERSKPDPATAAPRTSPSSGLNCFPDNAVCQCLPQGRKDCHKAPGCRARIEANASTLS